MIQNIPLSKLVSSRENSRKVKPEREAHHRLVASIRAFGLLEPLVVRPLGENGHRYEVIAGCRRLAALKEVHRGSQQDAKVSCEVRKVEDSVAESLSLSENFVREAMHPLDEAETFARLAGDEGKQAEVIAVEFGISPKYVRQRMKLATLIEPARSAYREGKIDTGTAEAFAAVPPERQADIWKEVRGAPRHAEHVRNIVNNGWIDASHALFDVATLPPAAVSRDLFAERVLVERAVFMEAQAQALAAERQKLVEEGWAEAIVGRREDVQDKLYAMDSPEPEYDKQTSRKLAELDGRRQKLEAKLEKIDDGDEATFNKLQEQAHALDSQVRDITESVEPVYSEVTKAAGSVFLILDPDGQVRREYRVPRHRQHFSGNGHGQEGGVSTQEQPKPPTSDDLSDDQLATTFTHQALAVREAILGNPAARKRIMAMILHEKVHSETLSVRHDANAVTLHATNGNGFASPAFDRLQERRAKLDPFKDEHHVEDCDAYARLRALSASNKIDALIDLLAAECITAHMLRRTELVNQLATELSVDVRQCWCPDALWLSGFQKIQLAHLLAQFRGPTYSPDHEQRKKSELVQILAQLFTDAAEGKLEDKKLAERVNRWLPSNLREAAVTDGK